MNKSDTTGSIVFYTLPENGGCMSPVGRAKAMNNYVALSEECPSALHELIHSLGFFHEFTRPDRDKYIQIVEDNIKKGN